MGLLDFAAVLNPVGLIANAGALANTYADYKSAEKDRESQEKINASQIEYWREQTEYNKPINQMTRLREAGLSPHLAYGQVADAKMAAAPQLTAPQWKRNPLATLGNFVTIQNQVMQNKLLNSQLKSVNLDNKYKEYENKTYMKNGVLKSDPSTLRLYDRTLDILQGLYQKVNNFMDSSVNRSGKNYGEWQLENEKRRKH